MLGTASLRTAGCLGNPRRLPPGLPAEISRSLECIEGDLCLESLQLITYGGLIADFPQHLPRINSIPKSTN